ncbi:tetratricopeptide repeat protein [uncultured Halopseudomonas sp.]|uniref:tetratricopeptide repeat protein n=1 Tax=uncultured Halopseudomonas sp. TaxID=2901193 RepID=UPI0030EB9037|tara:strand:+ start:13712 stop:14797 length:1086 start_codon:yes stop_codon:yes gene_type:complete
MRRLLCLLVVLVSCQTQAQQTVEPVVFQALNSALEAQQGGDLATALGRLENALSQTESRTLERALVQQRLGYLAIERERNAEAIEWLRKALAQDQLEAQAASQDRRNLAQLLAQEGQDAEAVSLLELELSSGTLSLETRRLLVQLYSRLGRYSKAIPLAEQVVSADPEVDSVWYQLLGSMNYRLGRYQAAEKWFRVLLRREPGNAEIWRQLAGIQSLDLRQIDAAATLRLAYEGGIGLSDTDLENLVALQVAAGAPWQAARLLEALTQQALLPASRSRSERIAQLWQQARDHDRAQEAWEALARRTGRSDHWMSVASIQLERGQWADLLDSLAQAQTNASATQRQIIEQWAGYARRALSSG